MREKTNKNNAIVRSNWRNSIVWGVLLIVAGVLFFIQEFFPEFDAGKFWPLLLIILGVSIVWSNLKK